MLHKDIVQADLELALHRLKKDRVLVLSLSAKRKIWDIEHQLLKLLSEYYDGLFVAYSSNLSLMLLSELKNMSGPIICIDDVLYYGIPSQSRSNLDIKLLQVNRHYDLNTEKTKITARYGFPSYQAQLAAYTCLKNGNLVDSLYTGYTLIDVWKKGLSISMVHAPISTPVGLANLKEKGITVNPFGYICDYLLCEIRDILFEGRPALHDNVFVPYLSNTKKFLGRHFPTNPDALDTIAKLSLELRTLVGIALLPGPVVNGQPTMYTKCSTRYVE